MLRPAQRPPKLKSTREIALMRESGKIVAEALRLCREMARPGTKTIEIDKAVEALYTRYGCIPLFKGYPGKTPFPACTCISVNEQVVHGIPGPRVLKDGDLIKIDTACKLNGWCADAAVTLPVGEVRPEWQRLVKVAWETLAVAIDTAGEQREALFLTRLALVLAHELGDFAAFKRAVQTALEELP